MPGGSKLTIAGGRPWDSVAVMAGPIIKSGPKKNEKRFHLSVES